MPARPLSRKSTHRAEIPIEPVQTFANEMMPPHIVSAVKDDETLVLSRRAEQAVERFLDGFARN